MMLLLLLPVKLQKDDEHHLNTSKIFHILKMNKLFLPTARRFIANHPEIGDAQVVDDALDFE